MTIALPWPRLPAGPEAAGTIDADQIGWAGPRQRALHAPRLDRLRTLALSAEMALVATGEIESTVMTVDLDHLAGPVARASAMGLAAVPLSALRTTVGTKDVVRCTVLVTTARASAAIIGAIDRADDEAIARSFGFPACCARASATWNAAGSDPRLAMFTTADGQVPDAHPLLAALGVGALRHVPCAPDCHPTRDARDRFIAAVRSIDREGAAWLEQLGAWPVSWSATGGIAEVRTPYFRYHHPIGAGTCRVVANARATAFAAPRDPRFGEVIERVLPTHAPAPLEALGLPQDWHRAGFDSPFAMRARYAQMLWQWSSALRGGDGAVLHYPCGSGLLGQMVADINPRLRFQGIDDDAASIALARTRMPGPLHRFAIEPSEDDADGRVAFVDPEPLLSRTDRGVAAIRAALARHAFVAIYASDRALRRFGTLASLAHAADLPIEAADGTTFSARVTA